MTRKDTDADAILALADEIDKALENLLYYRDSTSQSRLTQILWDNKAGIIAYLRRAAQTLSQPAPSPSSAWLIEWPISDSMVARWWHCETGWMIDHNKATRFSREEDAASYIVTSRMLGGVGIKATEHIWLAATPAMPAPAIQGGGAGNCGCTERCKQPDNCQYDVVPAPADAEPVAWVFPRRYGSGVQFAKPSECFDEDGNSADPTPLFARPQPAPTYAADVIERIASANHFDPATDDLTVPLAIKLAEAQVEILRLRAAPTYADGVEAAAKVAENFPTQIYIDGPSASSRTCKASTFEDVAEAIRALSVPRQGGDA